MQNINEIEGKMVKKIKKIIVKMFQRYLRSFQSKEREKITKFL